MQLTGAQIVIECLKEQKVDTVFGYPGGAILNVYDDQDKLCLAKEFEKYQKEKGKENPEDKAIRIRLDKKRTKQPEER